MSTRGLFGFRLEGKDYLTYNHCDSYPSGLGSKMAAFVVDNRENMDEIVNKVKNLRLVEVGSTPTEEDKKLCVIYEVDDLRVSAKSTDDWYCLLRGVQGKPEKILSIGIMIDNKDFIKDSLFCEWAYIINFDTGMFEVWQGFQKKSNPDNRYGTEPDNKEIFVRGEEKYYYHPCNMLKQIALDDEQLVEKVANSAEE